MYHSIARFLGIHNITSSHAEKLLSGLGAFIAIFITFQISHAMLGSEGYFITTSMGAAVVLLFAIPHSPLSQPWPVFAGNIISAIIGVSCAYIISGSSSFQVDLKMNRIGAAII